MTKAQRFPVVGVMHGQQRRSAQRITCSKCPATDDFIQSAGRPMAHEAAEQAFRRRGWTIGARASRDLCPTCSAAAPRSPAPVITLKPKEAPTMTVPKPTVAPMKAEPPREMTRDHKRIINLKLHEVYVDERTGYGPGWSDKRVAEDLGIPWGWVRDVREELFGPDRNSEEIAELKAVQDIIRKDIETAERRHKELGDLIAAIRASAEAVDARLKALAGRV